MINPETLMPIGIDHIYAAEAAVQAHCCAQMAASYVGAARRTPDGDGANARILEAIEEAHRFVDQAVQAVGLAAIWAARATGPKAHIAAKEAARAARSGIEALEHAAAANAYLSYCEIEIPEEEE